MTTPSPERRFPFLLVALVLVLGVLGIAALSVGGSDSGESAADDGSVLAFPLATVDGEPVTLAGYEGTPMVLNFFAAWCPPCRAELPDFEIVHQDLGGEVAIVGISRDSTTAEWLGLMEATGVTFDTYFEGQVDGIYEAVGGTFMPTTAFVDADGTVVHVQAGGLDAEGLQELIDTYLVQG